MLTEKAFRQLPLFVASMSRWDGDLSSASLALSKVLSRTNPVYYIDFPYTYADFWRERKQVTVQRRRQALLWGKNSIQPIASETGNLYGVTPRLVLPFYSLPPGTLYNRVSHYNNSIMASLVKKIVVEKKMKDYLFLNSFNPFYLSNIRTFLNPALSIYQSRDVIEQIHSSGELYEDACVRNSDLTLATSKQICRNIEGRTGCPVYHLPNGGDIHLFRTAVEKKLAKPAELQDIHTPIIGYTGAVCQRIDYELIVKLAEANPDKTIVFVGPRKDKHYTNIDLDAIPNIRFAGPKKLNELPAYLQHFDCAIIPFRYTQLTAGIYPLKINEYLAAGKAVVTTAFSADIKAFGEQVYTASSHEEFLQAVNLAIVDNSRERQHERLEAAAKNSWENRVEMFWNLAWEAYRSKCESTSRLTSNRFSLAAV